MNSQMYGPSLLIYCTCFCSCVWSPWNDVTRVQLCHFLDIVLTQQLSSSHAYTCGCGCAAFSLLLLSSTFASGGLCRLDPFAPCPSSSLPPACFHACSIRCQGQCRMH